MVHWPKFFWRRGGSPKLICSTKIFSGLVGHNPKKSGKFLSAPLIFSFPYAYGGSCLKYMKQFGLTTRYTCFMVDPIIMLKRFLLMQISSVSLFLSSGMHKTHLKYDLRLWYFNRKCSNALLWKTLILMHHFENYITNLSFPIVSWIICQSLASR
jgi:hypothetical protein